MVGKYKLTYFDGPGRGELIRLVFSAAKVEFEDDRFAFDAWPTIKPSESGSSLTRFVLSSSSSEPTPGVWKSPV